MTTFDKREEGFEKKFALDEEQKFKAMARRNRLLGQWAPRSSAYRARRPPPTPRKWLRPISRNGNGDVLHKVRDDIEAKGVDDDREPQLAPGWTNCMARPSPR